MTIHSSKVSRRIAIDRPQISICASLEKDRATDGIAVFGGTVQWGEAARSAAVDLGSVIQKVFDKGWEPSLANVRENGLLLVALVRMEGVWVGSVVDQYIDHLPTF